MKVLFVLPEYYPHSGGGISTYYLHYIKALRPFSEKIKVIVGSGYTNGNSAFSRDDVTVEYLQTERFHAKVKEFDRFSLLPNFRDNLAAAWAMYEQANAGEDFDIIECTDFGLGFIPWVIEGTKPVVTRMHGSSGQIQLNETQKPFSLSADMISQAELLLLPLCDSLITHSEANKNFWGEMLPGTEIVKIYPVFQPMTVEPLPFSERGTYGLVTARIQEWKGPVQLCRALIAFQDAEMPAIRWLGRDMSYNGHENTSDFLRRTFPSVWDKHILPGAPVSNESVGLLQQKAKFGVIPSTWDMFNFTCLEFMAHGTPVICSDGAGSSDLIRHGENGFKYAANEVPDLTECIRSVIGMNERAYNSMAQEAIRTVEKELSAQKLLALNLQQYDRLLNAPINYRANNFLKKLYSPSADKDGFENVLDTQPLKAIFKYACRRLKSKILN